jgi:hypothetical protein
MFLGLLDPDPPATSNITKKNLYLCCLMTSNNLLSLNTTDVNVPTESIISKKMLYKIFFVGILKVTEEKSRIRIRTKMSHIRNTDILCCRRNNVVHMEMTFCNKAMQAMQAGHSTPALSSFILLNFNLVWLRKLKDIFANFLKAELAVILLFFPLFVKHEIFYIDILRCILVVSISDSQCELCHSPGFFPCVSRTVEEVVLKYYIQIG